MVYLLHFSKPIAPGRHTAQHYIGFTDNLERRIGEHRAGTGARLCEVAKERGVSFVVAQIWEGDRAEERRLKNQKQGPRLCPICNRPHSAQPELFLAFTLADVEELAF